MKKRTDNGLRLDWSLKSTEERLKEVQRITAEWKGSPLREEDLELLSDYLAYGVDSDGKSPV